MIHVLAQLHTGRHVVQQIKISLQLCASKVHWHCICGHILPVTGTQAVQQIRISIQSRLHKSKSSNNEELSQWATESRVDRSQSLFYFVPQESHSQADSADVRWHVKGWRVLWGPLYWNTKVENGRDTYSAIHYRWSAVYTVQWSCNSSLKVVQ